MPLNKSPTRAAVSENIRTEMHVGKPQKQAIAIALNTARRAGGKFADGGPTEDAITAQMARQAASDQLRRSVLHRPHMAPGGVTAAPWFTRNEARGLTHGALHSVVPGRTDKLPISVSGGAYVLPADHVSHIGQNNTAAGAEILNKMFKQGPYGTAGTHMGAARGTTGRLPSMKIARMPKARGGATEGVPIIAAGGEFVISADKVAELGGGDIKRGHKILDHWVETTRKNHIKTLRKLKPPKKS